MATLHVGGRGSCWWLTGKQSTFHISVVCGANILPCCCSTIAAVQLINSLSVVVVKACLVSYITGGVTGVMVLGVCVGAPCNEAPNRHDCFWCGVKHICLPKLACSSFATEYAVSNNSVIRYNANGLMQLAFNVACHATLHANYMKPLAYDLVTMVFNWLS